MEIISSNTVLESSLISVIVPIYNAQKYLHRCINSILKQTYANFELLLIDDGSKDGSAQICDEYAQADQRIRVFHGKNAGVTYARKIGVMQSVGEYVCFVDSDDYILPSYLSELYRAVSAKGYDIAYAARNEGMMSSEEHIKALLRNTCDWGLIYKIYHRSLLTADVFDTPRCINIGEDLVANIKICSSRCNIVFINCNGYVYTSNPESVTHSRVFSLTYEEAFMQEVQKALGTRLELFEDEWWIFQLRCWKNLVLHKVPVDRNRVWVQEVIANAVNRKAAMTLGDRILVYSPWQDMAYFLLKALIFCKKVSRIIFDKKK